MFWFIYFGTHCKFILVLDNSDQDILYVGYHLILSCHATMLQHSVFGNNFLAHSFFDKYILLNVVVT